MLEAKDEITCEEWKQSAGIHKIGAEPLFPYIVDVDAVMFL